VDGLVDRIKSEVRSDPKVVATGGLARVIAAETKSINIVDEMLTLEGLRIIYKRNC
jgi:type III pantothenate kinase